MKTKYEMLVDAIRREAQSALKSVNDERANLMDVEPWQVEDRLAWRTDTMMTASAKLHQLMRAMKFLEDRTQAELDEFGLLEDGKADAVAVRVRDVLAQQCFSVVMRGTESSSSQAHNLASKCRIDAARELLQSVCWMGYEPDLDDVRAMTSAQDARRATEQAARAAQVTRVTYGKVDGKYYVRAYSRAGDMVRQDSSSEWTRKEQGKAAAEAVAHELRTDGGSVLIEAA